MKQKPRSRNEDVDFKEKNKRKFIKSEIVLLRVMKLFREFQVTDIFYQQASTVLLTHLLFSTLICLLSYTKIYNSSFELS